MVGRKPLRSQISPVTSGVRLRPSRIISTRGAGFTAIERRPGRSPSTSPTQVSMAGLHSVNRGGTFRRVRPDLPPHDKSRTGPKRLTDATVFRPIKIPSPAIKRGELDASAQTRKQKECDRSEPRHRHNHDNRVGLERRAHILGPIGMLAGGMSRGEPDLLVRIALWRIERNARNGGGISESRKTSNENGLNRKLSDCGGAGAPDG